MASEEISSFKAHHHSHHRFFQTKTFRLSSMLILTFTYFIVEIVVGNITNSVALVADAFHMLSDVISLVIAIVAVRIAKRRSDTNTYGWVRAEVVGANINTVFLLALCLTIVFDAIKRFIQPEPIENVNLLLIVGSVGLGINIIGLFLFQGFHGHSHGHTETKPKENFPMHHEDDQNENLKKFERHSTRALQEAIAECAQQTDNQSETAIEMNDNNNNKKKQSNKKEASMNMHGVFLHVLADALGSVVVIISALLIKYVPHDRENKKHWTVYIDPALSVIIVIIITISTISLFKETSSILLQTIPKHLQIHRIKSQLLENIPEIYAIHELHVWRLTDEKIIASAHLHRKTLSNYMLVANKVKQFFHSIGIHSVTIQYECDNDDMKMNNQQTTIEQQRNFSDDCLLRCENDECETQTCCTKDSDRRNTLSTNNIVQISSTTESNHFDNPLHTLTSVNLSD